MRRCVAGVRGLVNVAEIGPKTQGTDRQALGDTIKSLGRESGKSRRYFRGPLRSGKTWVR